MSDWPNPKPFAKSRSAPRKPYSRVSVTGGGANARASTPKQRRRQLEIMEVRVRPERAARLRTQRFFAWLSVGLLLAALGGGGYLAATRGAERLFFKNPEYNIAAVNVETDGVLSHDAVLEAAEVREGMNIFKLDLDRAKARIETLPQVQTASIRRLLPNQVAITINERKPVAWIAPDAGAKTREEVFASPRAFLVDSGGILLRPRKLLAQNYTLPIIRNANADRLTAGQAVDTEEMRASLDLLRAHQKSLVGARFQIAEIDLARGYGLVVSDHNGLQVLFGLDDPELQLKTLDTLLTAVANGGHKPATISLMTMEARQRNIPVTYQPDPTPAPPDPATVPDAGGNAPAAPAGSPGSPVKKEGASTPTDSSHQPASKPKEKEKPKSESKHHGDGGNKPREAHARREQHPAKKSESSEPAVRRALPVTQPFQPTR